MAKCFLLKNTCLTFEEGHHLPPIFYMLSWQYFFDQIYLINLDKRHDRYLHSVRQFDDYGIDFKRVAAIHDEESGARGLRDTMLEVFEDAAKKDYNNILVLEDDFVFVKEPQRFHEVMNAAVLELPPNYRLFYLGGQPTAGFSNYYSSHLLPAVKYFATHAVAYSRQVIKEILLKEFDYPIDNWIVANIQTLGNCYCVHPMLASQRPDMSDIGKTFIDWRMFMDARHQQKVNELNNKINGR